MELPKVLQGIKIQVPEDFDFDRAMTEASSLEEIMYLQSVVTLQRINTQQMLTVVTSKIDAAQQAILEAEKRYLAEIALGNQCKDVVKHYVGLNRKLQQKMQQWETVEADGSKQIKPYAEPKQSYLAEPSPQDQPEPDQTAQVELEADPFDLEPEAAQVEPDPVEPDEQEACSTDTPLTDTPFEERHGWITHNDFYRRYHHGCKWATNFLVERSIPSRLIVVKGRLTKVYNETILRQELRNQDTEHGAHGRRGKFPWKEDYLRRIEELKTLPSIGDLVDLGSLRQASAFFYVSVNTLKQWFFEGKLSYPVSYVEKTKTWYNKENLRHLLETLIEQTPCNILNVWGPEDGLEEAAQPIKQPSAVEVIPLPEKVTTPPPKPSEEAPKPFAERSGEKRPAPSGKYPPAVVKCPVPTDPPEQHYLDCTAIAVRLGIFSNTDQPHSQAVSGILKSMQSKGLLKENECKRVPFSAENNHSGYTNLYHTKVIDKARQYLDTLGKPESFTFDTRTYKIQYKDTQEVQGTAEPPTTIWTMTDLADFSV